MLYCFRISKPSSYRIGSLISFIEWFLCDNKSIGVCRSWCPVCAHSVRGLFCGVRRDGVRIETVELCTSGRTPGRMIGNFEGKLVIYLQMKPLSLA